MMLLSKELFLDQENITIENVEVERLKNQSLINNTIFANPNNNQKQFKQ